MCFVVIVRHCLCVLWINLVPFSAMVNRSIELLGHRDEGRWSDVGVETVACINIALDLLNLGVESSIRASEKR